MLKVSKLGVVIIGLACTAQPALGQSQKKLDCSSGKLWVPDNNMRVFVTDHCPSVSIAGNNNIVTIKSFGDLKVGGDNNTINYLEKDKGGQPPHWFGGNGNALVYIGEGAAPTKSKPDASKLVAKSPSRRHSQSKPVKKAAPRAAKRNGLAPALIDIPGPRMKLTGKYLGSLPAGYRMHVKGTNYWTNKSMTSTRMKHLHLTRDGQFEKSRFSVTGGNGGSVGTLTAGDKKGSSGSVIGGGVQGSGAQGVYLKTRKGLDPTMYGTYYISGNQIELRYATGKSVTHKFKTDGYLDLKLDEASYYVTTPKGWEKVHDKKLRKFRSIDGAYRANVAKIDGSVRDGQKWMQNYIARLKSKNQIVSATPIKSLKAGRFGVVKSTLTLTAANGGPGITVETYVRHGVNSTVSRLVQVTRYKGASGEARVLDFIERVG